MPKFTEVLKNRNFFFLWLGQIISQVGDRLGQMALIAFVTVKAPGSSVQIAKILSFTIIPVFLIGPVAGVYVDRWNRRSTMYISDLLRCVLVLTLPWLFFTAKNMGMAYFVIFLIFCIGRFFVPAKLAIIPDLVEKKDLLIANSLVNTTGMIAAVLGFGVSGVVVEWLHAEGGLYLDALSFLVSATLIFFIAKNHHASMNIRKVGKEIVEVISKSVIQEMKDATLYFFKKKDIRFTAWLIFILSSLLGAAYAVLISFVQSKLNSVTKDLGLLIMFLGIGLFAGSLLYGRYGSRLSQYKIIFVSLILSGLMLIIFSVCIDRHPHFLLAAGLSFGLGLLVSPIMIASNTIIHNVSDNEMMGKMFSALEIIMHAGFLIFMFVSSYLAEWYSDLNILVAVGCLFSLLGLVYLICHYKFNWLEVAA